MPHLHSSLGLSILSAKTHKREERFSTWEIHQVSAHFQTVTKKLPCKSRIYIASPHPHSRGDGIQCGLISSAVDVYRPLRLRGRVRAGSTAERNRVRPFRSRSRQCADRRQSSRAKPPL